MNRDDGFGLAELMVAIFLVALGILAAAPMFVYAMQGTATGADLGSVGAVAVERMEILRAQTFDTLAVGGDLGSNVAGYSDTSDPDYSVRWDIQTNATPPDTKLITLRAVALREITGPRREVILTSLRAR